MRLKNIQSKICKLVDKKNGLQKNGIKKDIPGYIYCISNSLYNIYSIEYYKLGNTKNLIRRLGDYNINYFEPIEIKEIIKVPYKFMFEILLFTKLKNYRIRKSREFFKNYDLIKKEFTIIKEILEKKEGLDSIEEYYDYVINNLESLSFTEEEILNFQICNRYKNKNSITMSNKISYNLKPQNYNNNYKNRIINYISFKKVSGYLFHLEIPEISYIFDNNVQVILILKNNISNFTEFIGNVKILNKIKIYDIKFTKLLLYDMLNNTHIKNKYFLCSYEKTIEVIMKIKEYYDCYNCIDKIKKEYLCERYNE